jgi:type II secretory pathway component PulK
MGLKKNLSQKNNGFALIFVLVFVAMILGIVADIVYESQINAKSTFDERDTLDAQTAALSGMEFAKIILGFYKITLKYQNNPLIPMPKKMFEILNGQALGSESLQSMHSLLGADLSKFIAPSLQKMLKDIPGYFVLKITTENAKLNLNMLQSRNQLPAQKALLRLFSTPDCEKFLDYLGYKPNEILDNVTAYINSSAKNAYAQNNVLNAYSKIGADYLPKQAPLETLQELRRIPGFHQDELYHMYSPYFTIWPLGAPPEFLNINSAPTELIAPLLTPLGQEIQDSDWDKFDDFREINTFKSQTDIKKWFDTNLTGFKNNLDSADIVKTFFGFSDTVFKVESKGVAHGVEKTLVIVFEQEESKNANKETREQPPTFKVLYSMWK